MIINDGLSIKTTSLCNRHCKNCPVMAWSASDPDYHTSIEDIRRLIEFSRKNNIQWKYILLSGGEPLLWKHIVEGTKLLFKSKITNDLKLFTNAIQVSNKAALDRVADILPHVHHFRVSQYNNNQNQIKQLRGRFGARIEVENRTKHMVPPKEAIPGTVPALCRCRAVAFIYGGFDVCGPARTVFPRDKKPEYELNMDSFTELLIFPKEMQGACGMCISNAHVQKHLKLVEA